MRPVDGPRGSRSLWRFSLRLYAMPGVERACLWLQERCGADVNLLLLCCWLASRGRPAGRRFLAGAMAGVAAWRREAVEPLRRVRRRLGRRVPGVPPEWSALARARTQAAELMAEHVEQLLLSRRAARLSPGPARARGGPDDLDRYRDLLGASSPAVERRLAVLREASAGAARRPPLPARRARGTGGRRWNA
jgi:uncharacterized protein (TIGR02444 family)